MSEHTYTHTNLNAFINTHVQTQRYTYEVYRNIFVFLASVLEVHQFAQEAVVAEAWLTAQEPFINSNELGASVDEVEQLIRRHEAFRKAAATWEERFSSLRRITTVISSLIIVSMYMRVLASVGESLLMKMLSFTLQNTTITGKYLRISNMSA